MKLLFRIIFFAENLAVIYIGARAHNIWMIAMGFLALVVWTVAREQ